MTCNFTLRESLLPGHPRGDQALRKTLWRTTNVRSVHKLKPALVPVAVFSAASNILLLSGSFYMLQVYDRVLTSHNIATLVGLTIFVAVAFAFQGFVDAVRVRLMVHLSVIVDNSLSKRVFASASSAGDQGAISTHVGHLDCIRGFLCSPAALAAFDLCFMPIFFLGCYMLHPEIGMLVIIAGCIVTALSMVSERMSRTLVSEQQAATRARYTPIMALARNSDVLKTMSLNERVRAQWFARHADVVQSGSRTASLLSDFAACTKSFRLFLQSGVLGFGAYLVIKGEMSAGSITAASIMSARALAPLEAFVAGTRQLVAAHKSFQALTSLTWDDTVASPLAHPLPCRSLELSEVKSRRDELAGSFTTMASFSLKAGDIAAIIGPSGSGKTSLLRVIVGQCQVTSGEILLDGVPINQYRPEVVGLSIGYVPQSGLLFEASIAENIARLDPGYDSEDVIRAARLAGAHDFIVKLPMGYNTSVTMDGAPLSAGQRQALALARALYQNPFVIVLDEPNSNLDSVGEQALTAALVAAQRRGAIAIIVTHRTAILGVATMVGLMSEGRLLRFGPKADIVGHTLSQVSPSRDLQAAHPC